MKTKLPVVKASIALEALIGISVTLLVSIYILGTMFTVYIDDRLEWSLLQAREDVSIYALPFMGHDRVVQKNVNAMILSSIASQAISRSSNNYGVDLLARPERESNLRFNAFGIADYKLTYSYSIPSIFTSKSKVIPIAAAVMQDGITFGDHMVYITTYGEKFHKSECFHLRKSKFAIEIELAKEKGYEPCKNCHTGHPEAQ